MKPFELDPQLKNDCFIVSESAQFVLLLMNNSLLPWFILVPKTDKVELYELDNSSQMQIFAAINKISSFLNEQYQPDKLNIAAIGNIVRQLHIHIIARYKTDAYWPGVVWSAAEKQAYDEFEVEKIKVKIDAVLEL